MFIISDGYINFNEDNNSKNLYFGYKIKKLSSGYIHLGLCTLEASDRSSKCIINDSKSERFSGINISYFSPNCFHIDHYIDSVYGITANHCLSEYEINNLNFSFMLIYDKNQVDKITLKITYDGYEYFNNDLLGLSFQNSIAIPCIGLGSQNSEIQILSKTIYP